MASFFPAAALGAAMVVLPAGSEIYARLSGKVASSGMLAGERVEAVVIAAVTAPDGRIAIPSGAILGGCLRAARPAAQDQRAMVELDFFELALPDGGRRPVSLRVTEVDNARESVDQEGRIVGILASETLVARIERGLERLAERFARLAGVLKTAKDAVLNPADTEITYEAGTDLTLRLLAPLGRLLPPPFGRDWALLPPGYSLRAELKALYAAVLRTFCLNAETIRALCQWETRRLPPTASSGFNAAAPSTTVFDTPVDESLRMSTEAAPFSPVSAPAAPASPRGAQLRWGALAGGACALGGAAMLAWVAFDHLA
ncbi:MAG: hypothetical protein K6T59_11415, partial [Bryobacteraceae bacterium]|nr:hypothetical protein [Bryobacteraceae bacterium]